RRVRAHRRLHEGGAQVRRVARRGLAAAPAARFPDRRMNRNHIALIRGINVGRAKRIAMADLRALIEGLGYRNVRTLLNSGNVVFSDPRSATRDRAQHIEKAMAAKLGISARVTVLSAAELAAAVRGNT